jgi:hypothetical protein
MIYLFYPFITVKGGSLSLSLYLKRSDSALPSLLFLPYPKVNITSYKQIAASSFLFSGLMEASPEAAAAAGRRKLHKDE